MKIACCGIANMYIHTTLKRELGELLVFNEVEATKREQTRTM